MRHLLTPDNVRYLTPVAQVRVGWITSVAWSPDGQMIAVAGGTQVRIYLRSFGSTPSYVLEGHDAPVKDIAFSRDCDLLAAVGADGQALIWSVDGSPRQVHGFSVPDSLTSVTFSSDAKRLVAGSGKGDIWSWDLRTKTRSQLPYPHNGEVNSVKWRMGNVFSAGHDGELLCRDMSDLRTAPVVTAAQSEWIRDFDLPTDSQSAFTVSKDGTLRGWTRSGDMMFRVMAHEGGTDCVAVHHSNMLLATGGRDNAVRLWNLEALVEQQGHCAPVAILTEHTKPVLTLAFNSQGTMLLTGSGDNTARLWSVEERNNAGN